MLCVIFQTQSLECLFSCVSLDPIWKKYGFQFHSLLCLKISFTDLFIIVKGKYDYMSWLGVKNKLLDGFCTIKLIIVLGK
jgi:hypothetical protein